MRGAKSWTMAKEEQKDVLEESASELLTDQELFAGEVHMELSERDVFAGDEDFYKLLTDSTKPKINQSVTDSKSTIGKHSSSTKSIWPRNLSFLQKVLVVCIFLFTSMLIFGLLKPRIGPAINSMLKTNNPARQVIPQTPTLKSNSPVSSGATQQQIRNPESVLSSKQPLSLKVARDFYMQEDYHQAYATYQQLRENLPIGGEEELLRDFLQLKMALCSNKAGDFEQASRLLTMASQSRSPAVNVVANYHLALLEIKRKQYLRARTRAYKTLALIKAVNFSDDWALSFECDCHFLAAECLTRNILSLSEADNELPDDLWSNPTATADPFDNLGETQLRAFLNSGSEHLGKGLLDPEIRRFELRDGLPRWLVVAYGTPIEELLAKLAAGADLDIHWAIKKLSGTDSETNTIRRRPVSLYLPAATSQQATLIAAGSVGLLARLEENPDKQKVTIIDPTDYSSLSEHISLLCNQAVSLWQRFVLTFYSDKRLGNCHFAMGILKAKLELPTEAIAEYKLVANRFPQMSLAPFALMHSSSLKANLRDYNGARSDLRQLIEQYPETEIYGKAYLRLADVTRQAGLSEQAARLYQRVYNFELSAESQTASALSAAECFYETQFYKNAAGWLIRYIKLAKDDENSNLYSAYFLLGKTYMALGYYQRACDAFQYALTEQSSREQYIEAIKALVEGHIQQGNFTEALNALESVRTVSLSQEQSVQILVLKSKVLRMLGLADAAIVSLRDRMEYVSVPKLKASISYELAQCHIEKGDLEHAGSYLIDVLGAVESGPFAHKAALELAEVCLKLDRNSQAVSVCQQLLDSRPSAQIRQKTLKVLAMAYSRQKNYDKAALALSGQWK
jgi:tetratricopeptide (TPR) repeat protein